MNPMEKRLARVSPKWLDRVPRGPARVLLTVISRDPNAVLRALSRKLRDDFT